MRIDVKMAWCCLLGLMFLHESLADVMKLKLNQNIVNALKQYREVWVNKENGDIFSGNNKNLTYVFISGFHYRPKQKDLVHIVNIDGSMIYDRYGKLYDSYRDALFCKKNGSVVIVQKEYFSDIAINILNGKEGLPAGFNCITDYIKDLKSNRVEANKKQFENIIKSGLVKENKFNYNIFANPFIGSEWCMPGISAFVKNDTGIINVYCAMKAVYPRLSENRQYSFITCNEYTDIIGLKLSGTGVIGNYEHTERQLLLNYYVDNKSELQFKNGEIARPMLDIFKNTTDLSDGNLLIWTNGNPCVCGGHENGRYSCVQWYEYIGKILKRKNVNIDVFFSYLEGKAYSFVVQKEESLMPAERNANGLNDYLKEALLRKMNFRKGYSDSTSIYNVMRHIEKLNAPKEYYVKLNNIELPCCYSNVDFAEIPFFIYAENDYGKILHEKNSEKQNIVHCVKDFIRALKLPKTCDQKLVQDAFKNASGGYVNYKFIPYE